MIIYPAIDIKGGKCVRLLQGRADDATVYGDDPASMAMRWLDCGAEYLHVVDLDGAFGGKGENMAAIERVVKAMNGVPVQTGGGIRTMDAIKERLDAGVTRVIIGTSAISAPDFAEEAISTYGARIVAGIDARDGKVALKGWTELTDVSPLELALKLKKLGVEYCVYTDISRDGMLSGANVQSTKELSEKTGLNVIASGGVSSLDDLLAIKKSGVHGAITGKAIYEGRLDLAEAIKLCK